MTDNKTGLKRKRPDFYAAYVFNHTPGPWRAGRTVDYGDFEPEHIKITAVHHSPEWAGQKARKNVAHVYYGQTKAEQLANARLIAAGPELLAALKGLDLRCQADHLNPCWDGREADVPGQHWGGEGKSCAPCTARAAIAKATEYKG